MNIVQAFMKFNKQLIILVSGFSGSQKTKIARFLADTLGVRLIGLNKFYFPEETYAKDENYVELKSGIKILNWDNVNKSIDWEKFNSYVNSNKVNGLIIHGFGFPDELLKFKPDYHIHVTIRKQKLLENRAEYIKTHEVDESIKDPEVDKLYLNTVVYPLYIKIKKDSKIDEYISSDELTENEMKKKVFNYLMNSIQKWLDEYNLSSGSKFVKSHKEKSTKDTYIDTSGKLKPKENYEDYGNYYDDFYYPDKKRILYDFNAEGIDYPEKFRKKYKADQKKTSSTSSTDDSDAVFLFTSKSD